MTAPSARLEMIEWYDHCSCSGREWESFETIKALGPIRVASVGWVIKEDRTSLIIVPTWHDDGGYGEILILKKCIASRQKLKHKHTK